MDGKTTLKNPALFVREINANEYVENTTVCLLEWLKFKIVTIPSVGKDEEKLELGGI